MHNTEDTPPAAPEEGRGRKDCSARQAPILLSQTGCLSPHSRLGQVLLAHHRVELLQTNQWNAATVRFMAQCTSHSAAAAAEAHASGL